MPPETRVLRPLDWNRYTVDSDTTANERKLIPALIKAANADGTNCHPGIRRLAKEARMKTNDVGPTLAGMVVKGSLQLVRVKLGGRLADVYNLSAPVSVTASGNANDTTNGTSSVTQNGSSVTQTVVSVTPCGNTSALSTSAFNTPAVPIEPQPAAEPQRYQSARHP